MPMESSTSRTTLASLPLRGTSKQTVVIASFHCLCFTWTNMAFRSGARDERATSRHGEDRQHRKSTSERYCIAVAILSCLQGETVNQLKLAGQAAVTHHIPSGPLSKQPGTRAAKTFFSMRPPRQLPSRSKFDRGSVTRKN